MKRLSKLLSVLLAVMLILQCGCVCVLADEETASAKSEFENWKGVVWGGSKASNVENTLAILSSDVNDLSDLGVGWARVGAKKEYTMLDNVVLELNSKGVNVLINYQDADSSDYTEKKAKEDNAYLKDLVSRYKNIVKYWEIGNEANLACGTDTQKLTNYAKRLRDAYNIIKTEDPGATVILGGISEWKAEEFVTAFKDITVDGEHAYDFFDEVAFHPYNNTPEGAVNRLTSFKTAMKNNWDEAGTKPIWITEIGFHAESGWDASKTPGYVESEDKKAEYLTEVLPKLHDALGVNRPVMWYRNYEFKSSSNPKGYGLTTTPTVENGVVTRTELPAYAAMKNLNTKSALSLPINDDFTGYAGTGKLPGGWEAKSGAASVITTDVNWPMKGECLKILNDNTAIRKFNIPEGGGIVEFSLRCLTEVDNNKRNKVISFKSGDVAGLKIIYNGDGNKKIKLDGYDELGGEGWWVNSFDIKVNCSEEAIGDLQPGGYELIFNKGGKSEKTVQGTLQNNLKTLNSLVFYSGYGNSAIYVDDVTVKVAEQNDVLKIDSVATTSEDITVGFDSSKTAVKGDIIVAADKTENDVNILSRIVGIKHGQLIPVGESSVTLPLGTAAKGETYRVFVFDSIQNLRPLTYSANTNTNK